jgi:RNA polymerase sigma-70 factor (ECF subfamily)
MTDFEELMAGYRDKVFRLCWAMLGNRAWGEEAAQEVFVRIWRGLPGYRGRSSLSTWIYAIARNTCLTARRSHAASAVLSMEEPGVRAAAEGRTGFGGEGAGIPDVLAAVSGLPEKQRQAVLLFYMEERSYEEVAAMLGLPVGTVKTHLHRARRRLAGALASEKTTKGAA